MRNPALPAVLFPVVALLLHGCESTAADEAPTHIDELPTLEAVEELRIGSVDDPVAGFTNIGGVVVAENGEAYVLESRAREVRVFSPEGQRVRTVGRSGSGPGEFESLGGFGLLGDTLWVADSFRNRISWFGPSGELLFTTTGADVPITLEGSDITIPARPLRPLPGGLIESEPMYSANLLTRQYPFPVIRFTREGEVVDTAGWTTVGPARAVDIGGRALQVPSLRPTSPLSTAVDGDSMVVQWQDVREGPGILEVVRRDERGDTLYHRRFEYTPTPVPASLIDSLMEGPLRIASMFGSTPGEMERILRPQIELPASRPPVRSVFADREGGAWIELATLNPDVSEWIRIEPDGAPAGRVALPAGIQMMWASGPTAWALKRDELGVPWLLRLTAQ